MYPGLGFIGFGFLVFKTRLFISEYDIHIVQPHQEKYKWLPGISSILC